MLRWAFVFAMIALLCGLLGFTGGEHAFAGLAEILFFVAIALFLIFLALGLMAARAIKGAADR